MKKTKKKVLMIWTGNNHSELGGVGYYRVTSPAKKFIELGYSVEFCSGEEISTKFGTGKYEDKVLDIYSDMLSSYDLIWMKHTDNAVAIQALFGLKDRFMCKIVWDFDDDLFNVRESQPAWAEYNPSSIKRAMVGSALSFCDAITVSTPYLKKSLTKMLKDNFNIKKEIYICPNFVNIDEWKDIKYRPSNSPKIGYYGSTTHSDDFNLIKPSIYKILEKYPLVKFEILGAFSTPETIEIFKDCPNPEILKRISLNGGTSGWKGFIDLLQRTNWDIALAPLIDDEFNRSKSNIKWMETAMKSIPCVCSNVEPYKTTVTHETGVLAKEDEWFNKLSYLIDNPEKRVEIGIKANDYIKLEYDSNKQIKHWEKALNSILE